MQLRLHTFMLAIVLGSLGCDSKETASTVSPTATTQRTVAANSIVIHSADGHWFSGVEEVQLVGPSTGPSATSQEARQSWEDFTVYTLRRPKSPTVVVLRGVGKSVAEDAAKYRLKVGAAYLEKKDGYEYLREVDLNLSNTAIAEIFGISDSPATRPAP